MKKWLIVLFLITGSAANATDILVIGDSLSCGTFGQYLVQQLTAWGHQVTLYCAVSSAPTHWLNGENPTGQQCQTRTSADLTLQLCGGTGQVPKLATLLSEYKGAAIIVALGTNSLLSPTADSTYDTMAKDVRTATSTCAWVGPPNLNPSQSKGFPAGRLQTEQNNLTSFYASLPAAVGVDCSLIDSRAATAAGTPGNQTVDGVHRTDAAGQYWVDQIATSLRPI